MSGAPPGGQPAWYQGYQQQSAANEDSGGLDGVTPPAMKFKEGDNHFRLMPPAEAIPQALANAKAGQAADWSQGFFPVCRMKVYFPTFGSSPAKGISLFGSKAVVSPCTIFPNEGGPVYGNDPAQEWLEAEGIRWMKKEELDRNPMAYALKEALGYKDRVVMQLVQLGVSQNGAPVVPHRGQLNVETYFVFSDDFDEKWKRPLFDELIERGRVPFDPGWYGIHFGIFRKGKDINTAYTNLRGLFGAPYGDATQSYGYPLLRGSDGHPDWQEIERILAQVKPWKEVMHIATPEEVKQQMDRTIKAIHDKFAPASAQVPGGMPPGPPGGYAPPASGLPPANPAGAGGPPAAPPPPPGQPVTPSFAGPPPGPPGVPPAGPPQYQQPQPQYAPPPGPPQYQQQPAGGGYPPPNYQQPAPGQMVPATPPNTRPISAPPQQGVNPNAVDHAAQNTAPPQQYQQQPPGPPGVPPAGPPQYQQPPQQQQQYAPPAGPPPAPPVPPAPPNAGAR